MAIPVLAIDGPSGSGKGTVSRAVAKRLGWHYLDSGSIYRSLAIAVSDSHIAFEDVSGIIDIARHMDLQFECNDALIVRLNSQDITARLPAESTGNTASKIAAIPEVRRTLLQKQRDFCQPPGLVADGRDMGTVVFPEAPYKVFLTASAAVRAKRRYKQLIEKGIHASLSEITQDIEERDRRDQARQAAPLVQAADAFYLDSSNIPVDQVIEIVLNLIR